MNRAYLETARLLIQSIGLQEAMHSSEIENIVTTNDKLHRTFARVMGITWSPARNWRTR